MKDMDSPLNIAAIVIAFCALVFTGYQTYATRRHNRLSVRPKLTLDGERRDAPGVGKIHFYLVNNGLGPAIIKKFQFVWKGEAMEFDSSEDAFRFFETVFAEIVLEHRVSTLSYDHVMAPSDRRLIFDITFTDKNGEGWDAINGVFDELTLVVTYHSMYGEPFEFRSIGEIS